MTKRTMILKTMHLKKNIKNMQRKKLKLAPKTKMVIQMIKCCSNDLQARKDGKHTKVRKPQLIQMVKQSLKTNFTRQLQALSMRQTQTKIVKMPMLFHL